MLRRTVRGYAVLHPFSEHPEFQSRHTIAHELGYIMLNTHNEAKAEKRGMELLKDSQPSIIASK
jgi:hypothetical protein